MPTYEYRCRDCGEDLEVVQSFTDDALTKCPACGGSLRKIFGNVGISFKGSGFYKNDARNGNGNGKKAAEAGASSSDSASSDSSSSDSSSTSSDSSSSTTKDTASKPDAKKADKKKSASSPA
jgi:putative FmdB family regulatory protein